MGTLTRRQFIQTESALKDAYAIGEQFETQDKIVRLQTAMLNTVMMVRAVISTQQWQEQLKAQSKA